MGQKLTFAAGQGRTSSARSMDHRKDEDQVGRMVRKHDTVQQAEKQRGQEGIPFGHLVRKLCSSRSSLGGGKRESASRSKMH